MSIIYVLIPVAMIFTIIAVALFIWAARRGQFDDLDRHGRSVLYDDARPQPKTPAEPTKPDDRT